MKLAARFPVKDSIELAIMIAVIHLVIGVMAIDIIGRHWFLSFVLLMLAASTFFSWRQYRSVTSAPDDICWTGENWMISQFENGQNQIAYLNLDKSSWISSFACLLHFNDGNQMHYWLFTKRTLGKRAYRELCFLAIQDLKK